MKLTVTCFLNKRAILPWLFCKYTVPMMRQYFDVDVFIIHHDIHIEDCRLESNRVGRRGLENVREFVASGRYGDATVITHREICHDFYPLPSFKIGMKLSTDLHLWLEDDAIIYDPFCNLWSKLMSGFDIGLFRCTENMCNCAFMLTTADYDAKLLKEVEVYKNDGKDYGDSSQFEHLLRRLANSVCVLHPLAAIRHHPRGKFKTTVGQVAMWLREQIPHITEQDIELLKIDYS